MAFTPDQKFINIQNKNVASKLDIPAAESIGTYYLADNPKYFEPQRSNTFQFYVSGLSKKLNITNNNYAKENADDVLRLSVKTSSVPHFNIGKVSISRGNSNMNFAGKPEFSDGTIVLNDYIGAGTKEVLMGWQAKAYNVRTEKVGLASDYKTDAYLIEYTPEYSIVRKWVLRGCWISAISEGEYDSDSSEAKQLTATLVYDKAYIDDSEI